MYDFSSLFGHILGPEKYRAVDLQRLSIDFPVPSWIQGDMITPDFLDGENESNVTMTAHLDISADFTLLCAVVTFTVNSIPGRQEELCLEC